MTLDFSVFSHKHQLDIIKGLESIRNKVISELDDFRTGCLLECDTDLSNANREFRDICMDAMIRTSYCTTRDEDHELSDVIRLCSSAFAECFAKVAKSHNYRSFNIGMIQSNYYFGSARTIEAIQTGLDGNMVYTNQEPIQGEFSFCERAYANMRNVLDRINTMIVVIATTNHLVGNFNDSNLMRIMYDMRDKCMQYVADTAIMAGGESLADYTKMMYDTRFTVQGKFEVPAVHFLVDPAVSHFSRVTRTMMTEEIMTDIRESAIKYGHKLV